MQLRTPIEIPSSNSFVNVVKRDDGVPDQY